MMSLRNKIILVTIVALCFLSGLMLGRFWKYFPYITWKSEVDIVSGLSLLVTIAIAILIPLMVKKLVDDNTGIKSFLVEEIKSLIRIFEDTRAVISDTHTCGSFTAKDRDQVNYHFHEAELKIDSIQSQMEVSFKKHSNEIIDILKSNLLAYKDYLTGGEMMYSSFTQVDERFYRENNNKYSVVETGLKTVVHKIHRL